VVAATVSIVLLTVHRHRISAALDDQPVDLSGLDDMLSILTAAMNVAAGVGVLLYVIWTALVLRSANRYGVNARAITRHWAEGVALIALGVLPFFVYKAYVARVDDGYREIGPEGLNLDITMIEAMATRIVIAAAAGLHAWVVYGRLRDVVMSAPADMAMPPELKGSFSRWRQSRQGRVYR